MAGKSGFSKTGSKYFLRNRNFSSYGRKGVRRVKIRKNYGQIVRVGILQTRPVLLCGSLPRGLVLASASEVKAGRTSASAGRGRQLLGRESEAYHRIFSILFTHHKLDKLSIKYSA